MSPLPSLAEQNRLRRLSDAVALALAHLLQTDGRVFS